jgi:hypothetical protein
MWLTATYGKHWYKGIRGRSIEIGVKQVPLAKALVVSETKYNYDVLIIYSCID